MRVIEWAIFDFTLIMIRSSKEVCMVSMMSYFVRVWSTLSENSYNFNDETMWFNILFKQLFLLIILLFWIFQSSFLWDRQWLVRSIWNFKRLHTRSKILNDAPYSTLSWHFCFIHTHGFKSRAFTFLKKNSLNQIVNSYISWTGVFIKVLI